MKTAKLVIGIISIVLFAVILFQSCVVGTVEIIDAAITDEEVGTSGSAGMFLAFCMLVAGIVGIATRKGKAGGFVSGGFYALGGIIGIVNIGVFSDLIVWSVLSFIFAGVFIIGSVMMKKPTPTTD